MFAVADRRTGAPGTEQAMDLTRSLGWLELDARRPRIGWGAAHGVPSTRSQTGRRLRSPPRCSEPRNASST